MADNNCTSEDIDPSYIIIKYRTGTLLIEENLCNNETIPMMAYTAILEII